MTYPSKERYEALYSRFLQKGVDYLIDVAELEPMERVLDLCCGSGRLSKRILEAHDPELLVGVEQCQGMVDHEWWAEYVPAAGDQYKKKPWSGASEFTTCRVRLCIEPVRVFFSTWAGLIQPFDVVFCQQAVNYWLDENTAELVALMLSDDGGRFVFNTFKEPPSKIPQVKQYLAGHAGEADASHAVEVYYMTDDNMVHHIQARTGHEPHQTKFRWISPREFEDLLSPHFHVAVRTDEGKSAVYVCTRK